MHPQNPYPPPPGLVAPLGPPQRVPAGARTTAVVLLGAALVGLSTFGGYEVARNGGGRLQVLLWFLPAIACLVALTTLLQDTVYSVRSDGWVLEGTGLLGRQGIDLTRLISVTSTATGRAVQLVLRDDVAGVTVDANGLRKAGPAVLDVVGRAVWAGQEQGRYVVPRAAAGVWGMPTRPDAPATGRTGTAGKALAVVGLLLVGTVVGVVLALA
ncbi:hypothetical protein SAMN05660199_02017 [Klenkia soli]|uniref:PH domain-containing protein n=1 Tax=Klenkia soli TaxID=1052260 RepID=A0A1H0JM65_9ACTN|nr:hypothetical protein [Klenkia soli]SDO44868.1 hypothetical protein SAMN05660199_02017 [Klenkia soli]